MTVTISAYDLAQRFVGVSEVAGTLDNPQIMAMLKLDGNWPEHDETPWPLCGDTEVLTDRGWMRLDILHSNADVLKIMQVNPDTGVASLSPFQTISKRYQGDVHLFERRGLTLACDPKHRFYGEWGNRGISDDTKLEARTVDSLKSTLCLPLLRDYIPNTRSDMSEYDIKFLAAYLADGNRQTTNRIQFNVSREDKKEFLRSLNPINERKRNKLYGKNKNLATQFLFKTPDNFDKWLEDNKCLSWHTAFSWDAKQRKLFIDTYQFFDGSICNYGAGTITTTSMHTKDILQALLFLSHYRVSGGIEPNSFDGVPCKDLYRLHYSNTHNSMTLSRDHLRLEPFSGNLYCVTVPDGAFVARSGQMPFVSGNCSAFVNYIAWLLRLPRSKSLAARSWLNVGVPVDLPNAVVDSDVVILSRNGGGHVGFFAGMDTHNQQISLLGGNQGNKVCVAGFSIVQLLGIRRL